MDKAVYKELAGSLKDAFGVQREIKAKETPRGINIIAREFSPGRPQETTINEVRQMTTDESKLHPVFTKPSDQGQENQDKRSNQSDDKSHNALSENIEGNESVKSINIDANVTLSEEELEQMARIHEDSERVREALDDEIRKGIVELEVEEKKIILRVREKGSFPSGSAQIIKPFKVIVEKISDVFKDFEGMIIVSGHTDNIPINTYRFRSNWELSSSRAVSVLHELSIADALKYKKFQIVAYADTRPVDVNTSWEGRSRNRRVEIMMDYANTTNDSLKEEAEATVVSAVNDEPAESEYK